MAILLVGCSSSDYVLKDPTLKIKYQMDPSMANLLNLSKAYGSTISHNRMADTTMPGLYADYAVSLALLGKRAEANRWFNQEMLLYPYAEPWIQQLKVQLIPEYADNQYIDTSAMDTTLFDGMSFDDSTGVDSTRMQAAANQPVVDNELANKPIKMKMSPKEKKKAQKLKAKEKKKAQKEKAKAKKQKEKDKKAEAKAKAKAKKDKAKQKELDKKEQAKARQQAREQAKAEAKGKKNNDQEGGNQ